MGAETVIVQASWGGKVGEEGLAGLCLRSELAPLGTGSVCSLSQGSRWPLGLRLLHRHASDLS